jgi:hypothetical protein
MARLKGTGPAGVSMVLPNDSGWSVPKSIRLSGIFVYPVEATGRATGNDQLRTLAGYRQSAKGVIFGVNRVVAPPGVVKVGAEVRLTDQGPGPTALKSRTDGHYHD